MIRRDAEMSTARFCRLVGAPEGTHRRWQQRARAGRPAKQWGLAHDREPAADSRIDEPPYWRAYVSAAFASNSKPTKRSPPTISASCPGSIT